PRSNGGEPAGRAAGGSLPRRGGAAFRRAVVSRDRSWRLQLSATRRARQATQDREARRQRTLRAGIGEVPPAETPPRARRASAAAARGARSRRPLRRDDSHLPDHDLVTDKVAVRVEDRHGRRVTRQVDAQHHPVPAGRRARRNAHAMAGGKTSDPCGPLITRVAPGGGRPLLYPNRAAVAIDQLEAYTQIGQLAPRAPFEVEVRARLRR